MSYEIKYCTQNKIHFITELGHPSPQPEMVKLAVKIEFMVFLVVAPCSVVVGY
jgi:hypothetical protein